MFRSELPNLSGLAAQKEREEHGNVRVRGPACACTNGHAHSSGASSRAHAQTGAHMAAALEI